MIILRVAVPVPLPGLFDYLAPESPPPPGARVLVPFGNRRLVGIVMAHAGASDLPREKLKPVVRVLDTELLDNDMLAVLDWCARYYCQAVGEFVSLALPAALRRVRGFQSALEWLALTDAGRQADFKRAPRQAEIRDLLGAGPLERSELGARVEGDAAATLRRMRAAGWIEAVPGADHLSDGASGPELNPDQRQAVAAILRHRNHFGALLLDGVTGSGKTEVYLQAARAVLRRGGQVLVVLPEIGLTPQLVRRIERRLGRRAWLYHSRLSDSQRLATWQAARDGHAGVVVGTRSAVFLPLARPALFVVDEEHDGSLRQHEGVRYSGRDVAVVRARHHGIPVVLGSATPSLESLDNVRAGRYLRLELPARAGAARPPEWRVVDLTADRPDHDGLTANLRTAIGRALDDGGQVLLFRNRRGYAPLLICTACGWQADCRRCDAHMTWHRSDGCLRCHHCGAERPVPPRCPECEHPELQGLGVGTERLEAALARDFPDVPVHRIDRDVLTGNRLFEVLESVAAGAPCILVGTQMLAKGHHLPGVTLAAVIDADQALFSADFRAPERLAQTVIQVAGRTGRGNRPGRFLLQTRHPDHPWIRALGGGRYAPLAEALLDERLAAGLPPAGQLALLRAEAHDAAAARVFLDAARARAPASGDIELAGPFPAILPRRGGYHRLQVWVQSTRRGGASDYLARWLPAVRALDTARKVRWQVEVDPHFL